MRFRLLACAAFAFGCDARADAELDVWVSVAAPDVDVAVVRARVDADEPVELIAIDGGYRGVLRSREDAAVVSAIGFDPANVAVARASSELIAVGDGTVIALQLAQPSSAPKNKPPVIDSLAASQSSVPPGTVVSLVATAHDPDGDPIAFAWSGPGTFGSPSSASTSWTAPAEEGKAKLTVTATDPKGAQDAMRVSIDVKVIVGKAKVVATFETAPQVTKLTLDTGRLIPGVRAKLQAIAFDPEHTGLTYAWSVDCPATLTGSGKTIRIRVPATTLATSCTAHVDVEDGAGLDNFGELTVAIGAPVPPDGAPIIDTTFQSVERAGADESVVLRATAHDPEGEALTFAWSAERGTLGSPQAAAGSTSTTWRAPADCFAGDAEIELATTDSSGAVAITTFAVTGRDTCP